MRESPTIHEVVDASLIVFDSVHELLREDGFRGMLLISASPQEVVFRYANSKKKLVSDLAGSPSIGRYTVGAERLLRVSQTAEGLNSLACEVRDKLLGRNKTLVEVFAEEKGLVR